MKDAILERAVKDVFNRIYASARRSFKDRFEAAKTDMRHLKDTLEDDVRQYTALRLDNKLTKSEMEELLGDKLRLASMAALTQTGLTLVEVDKFRHAVVKIAVDFVFDRLLPL